jgi:hypothetical protein
VPLARLAMRGTPSPAKGCTPAIGRRQDNRLRAAQIGVTAACAIARFAGGRNSRLFPWKPGIFSIVLEKCRLGTENGEANQALAVQFP